jgi:hypothetical protein
VNRVLNCDCVYHADRSDWRRVGRPIAARRDR